MGVRVDAIDFTNKQLYASNVIKNKHGENA